MQEKQIDRKPDQKAARLAKALKENLKRRKSQAKARQEKAGGEEE